MAPSVRSLVAVFLLLAQVLIAESQTSDATTAANAATTAIDAQTPIQPTTPENISASTLEVRLVGGSTPYEGNVEVLHEGVWGTVCDNGWDVNDATVVCRMLGFLNVTGIPTFLAEFGIATRQPIHLSNLACTGSEVNIKDCGHTGWGASSCFHWQDAGVSCQEKTPWEVRLVGGMDDSEGRVEVFDGDSWGTVCDEGFDYYDAIVICRMLPNYNGSESIYILPGAYYGEGTGEVKLTSLRCTGNEANLTYCRQSTPANKPCPHSQDVGIVCQYTWRPVEAQVRLANSSFTSSNEGPVEVFHNGRWGPICEVGWDREDVRVVCRQLGLSHGSRVDMRVYHPDSYSYNSSFYADRTLLSHVECQGSETNIGHCQHSFPWGARSCSFREYYAGVACIEGENPPWEVRLVGGTNDSLEGRLEVFDGESWGTVCDSEFDSNDARVVCRMLQNSSNYDHGNIYVLRNAYYGAGSGEVKLTNLKCWGNENNLTYCPQETPSNNSCPHSQDVGIICNYVWRSVDVQVRLADNGTDEGRVEVFYNGRWGTVSSESWDVNDARVVCRQLGLPHGQRVEAKKYRFYGSGLESQPIHLQNVYCFGTEENIGHCYHNNPWGVTYGSRYNAGVACYQDYPSWQVRLSGGEREGRVEVSTNDTWGTVCDELFDDSDARVICSMLGFHSGSHYAVTGAYFGEGTGPVLLTRLGCVGSEADLSLCQQSTPSDLQCPHSRDAGVVCDYRWMPEDVEVRLAGGKQNEGRVEVLHNGHWGTVCSQGWDVEDARVVCRQLGLASGYIVQARTYGEAGMGASDQKIHVTDLQCWGFEVNLGGCHRYPPWGVHSCNHSDDAGVACLDIENSAWKVRLVGGTHSYEGRLEVFDGESWGTVCDEEFDTNDAEVVCRMLGLSSYSIYVLPSAYYGEGSGQVKLTRLNCTGVEVNITYCGQETPSNNTCPHSQDVGIVCYHRWVPTDVEVRLVNGTSTTEGLVEVFHNGRWGPVCSRSWDVEDVRVVCRQLGLPYGSKIETRRYSYHEYDITSQKFHLGDVLCTGSEKNIGHCGRNYPWGVANCDYYFNSLAGVACIDGENPPWEVRLVGGTDYKEGRVEVFDGDSWGTVCDDGFDQNDANVICSMLPNITDRGDNYILPSGYYGKGTKKVKLTSLGCTGSEANLTYCVQRTPARGSCPHSRDVGISCNYTWRPVEAQVRLANTSFTNSTEGPVEVFHHGRWGPICWYDWDVEDARVVCRQLGLPYGSGVEPRIYPRYWYRSSYYTDRAQLSYVRCEGSETNIGHCHHSDPWGAPKCLSWNKIAGVACSEAKDTAWQVRLVGGTHSLEGRLEVFDGESWGTVCDEGFDFRDARVVCRMLQDSPDYYYREAYIVRNAYYGAGSGEVKLTNLRCRGHEGNLTYCPQETPSNTSCPHSQDVGIICKNVWRKVDVQVRLADNASNEGRVEIFHNGQWGTISSYSWDVSDARVVCRQLGLPHGQRVEAKRNGFYGSGLESQPIHLQDVYCNGNEENIGHCPRGNSWGVHSSSHSYDAGVACYQDSLPVSNSG